jgi:hypothetical protein
VVAVAARASARSVAFRIDVASLALPPDLRG